MDVIDRVNLPDEVRPCSLDVYKVDFFPFNI